MKKKKKENKILLSAMAGATAVSFVFGTGTSPQFLDGSGDALSETGLSLVGSVFDNSYNANSIGAYNQPLTIALEDNSFPFTTQDVLKAMGRKGRYRLSTIIIKCIDVMPGNTLTNFMFDCALNCTVSQRFMLLESITLSGKNYRKKWFEDLLRFLSGSDSLQLKRKCKTLLRYHFGVE